MDRCTARSIFTSMLALMIVSSPSVTQDRPTLTPDDYGQFETLVFGATVLSPDGRWLAYGIRRVNEENELRIRELRRDSTIVAAWGSNPTFSANSLWLAWTIGISPEERERLQEQKKPVRMGVGLRDLETGTEREFETTSRFAFDATGEFLALHGYAPEEPSGKGGDLRVLNLTTGTEVTFGNVSAYAWSDIGSLVALSLATGSDVGNGVQVYDATSGRLHSLDASSSMYTQLAWREDAFDLAVLRSTEAASEEGTGYDLLAWRGLDATAERLELDLAATGVADTLELVRHRRPTWSDDGRLSFGLRPKKPDKEPAADTTESADSSAASEPEEDVELPGVQIWHSNDVRTIPMQMASASRDGQRTLLSMWDPDRNRVVQVGTGLMEQAQLIEGWHFGMEAVAEPYPWGTMFGRPYRDYWIVDLDDGERTKLLEQVRYAWASGAGNYVMWFDGEDYWTHHLQTGSRANITESLPAAFADTATDTPTDLMPPHRFGGWLEDDAAVLLYDEFDVWRVAPDGSGGERLTAGAEEQVIYRVARLDFESPTIDPDEPIYLSIRGEWSENRGYARLRLGRDPERLIFLDEYVRQLDKADSADVYVFRSEAFDDPPDLFVAGPRLDSPRQVSNLNPFQEDYAWGHAELVEWVSETGRRLQGSLVYPANHDPAQRYPMIVYTYEILSPGIHAYEVPSERDYYNFTAWTQNGYFVLLPDIVYRWRDPGVSAVESVRPAVAKTVEMGLVDGARVGLIGHSWGGYQATFMPTRTDIFAASVAGAPLTDFVSFMGQFHWNPGMPETAHWETGQGRMEVPYWEDAEAHHRNSPIHKVHEMETPLLMAFGDDDGVVDWDQGTEFYNFARRAGKQMVLLVYEGEDHGFREKPNQIDYHRRILEWFGHYLKGEPAPKWITDGVPYDKHEEEGRRVAKDRSGS
ncbi:MAG: prolyl oligopeptidase family serine peptidase [Gemmatimonadota bacterium]|nr:MAG: prolyl oligopeptidase family serine peptidase [Gemmatimonadota bacterium]